MGFNKEETKEMIEVMQAYIDGKKIEFECRSTDSWKSSPMPGWDWYQCKYRVKPVEYVDFHKALDHVFDGSKAIRESADGGFFVIFFDGSELSIEGYGSFCPTMNDYRGKWELI